VNNNGETKYLKMQIKQEKLRVFLEVRRANSNIFLSREGLHFLRHKKKSKKQRGLRRKKSRGSLNSRV